MKTYKANRVTIHRQETWFNKPIGDSPKRTTEEQTDIQGESLAEVLWQLRDKFNLELIDVEIVEDCKSKVSTLIYSQTETPEGLEPTEEQWKSFQAEEMSLIATNYLFNLEVVIVRGLKLKELKRAGLQFIK